jgi:gp45 sliding clamp, C terminal
MNIETNTLNVLKNFAKINPSIFIDSGNCLKTISTGKAILAKATVETEFPKSFSIYNLDRFLATISLFNNPNYTFEDKYLLIKDDNKSIKYHYASDDTVVKPPAKEIKIPSVDIQLEISTDNIKEVEKAASILGVTELAIAGSAGRLYLQAIDSKNDGCDNYSIEIGETDKEFNVIFKFENMKLYPDNYDVFICSKAIALFKGKKENIEYFIAIEGGSTY